MVQCANAQTIAVVGSKMGTSGTPDRYVAHPIFRGWLEMKNQNGKPSDIQRAVIRKLISCGDIAFIVRYYGRTDSFGFETLNREFASESYYMKDLPREDGKCGVFILQMLAQFRDTCISKGLLCQQH